MARRAFQMVVLFFAIYAFVFVPLGKRTALEHVRAIIGTPAAQEAASEVKGGVERLVGRLRSEAQRATENSEEERERLSERQRGTERSARSPRSAEPEPSKSPRDTRPRRVEPASSKATSE